MRNLFVMVGVPGSGKSTFLKENFEGKGNVKIVSRDAIRFSFVKPDEPYFSKESPPAVYRRASPCPSCRCLPRSALQSLPSLP